MNASFELVAQLVEYATRGEREHLRALTLDGVDLNQRDLSDRTALMCVAARGEVLAVQSLLAAGADANARNHMGRTALMYAAYRCHTEIVQMLVAGGADPSSRDRAGRTPLDYCRLNTEGNSACLAALHSAGAQAGARAPRGFRRALRVALDGDQFSDWQGRRELIVDLFVLGFVYFLTVAVGWLLLAVLTHRQAVGSGWAQMTVGLYAMVFLWVIVRYSIPFFPAVVRLLSRLSRRQVIDDAAPKGTEPVDVRSPEFFCAILEAGQNEFVRWQRRNRAGVVLTAERLEWPLVLSVGALVLWIVGLVLLSLGPFQLAMSDGEPKFAILDATVSLEGRPLYSGWHVVTTLAVLAVVEMSLCGVRLRSAQRRVDGLAADVNWLLDQSSVADKTPVGPFAVYLRPFYSTNRLHFGGSDLETLLAYSFLPHMPVIALGRPGEHLGAGRVLTSDSNWKDDVTRLIGASTIVICVPSATEGTLWELGLLVQQQMLDKTVLIMPPATQKLNYAGEWESVRQSPLQTTLALPPYVPEGLIFQVHPSLGLSVFTPLRLEAFTSQPMYPHTGGSDSGNEGSDASSEGNTAMTGGHAGVAVATASGIAVAETVDSHIDLAIDSSFEAAGAMDGGDGAAGGDGGGWDSDGGGSEGGDGGG